MIPLPTLRQIQFLLALKIHKNFGRAAEASGVTQSTLSAAIQEMETILGTPVIDRSSRKAMRFTPIGDELAEQGKNMIAGLTDIAERARRAQDMFAWPLRVGVIPTIAPYLLPRILDPLQKQFPDMKLHIHEVQSAQLVAQVREGQLDFGILALPFDIGELQSTVLAEEKFFCAAPSSIFKNKETVSLKDIQSQKLLLLSDGHCLRDHVLDACHLKQGTQDISTTSLSTLVQLVAQNYGITLLPEMVVRDKALPKNVRVLPIAPALPKRKIGIVWRKNAVSEKPVQLLAKAIQKLA